ncbi:DUF6088 family protein [Aliikangiella sp. IMCC44359]|uniref:DUF6088 family protein n=1 Tax=Aliikangiella sp. IMCC44359 TaxID=3459125 RepID=UPI00403A9FB0
MTLKNAVEIRLRKIDKGTPFTIKHFSELGTRTSVQRILSKLCTEDKLVRVMRGFYVRPRILAYAKNAIFTTSAESLAKAWAEDRDYQLVEQGIESAYRLRFQTQMPVKLIYWSDGPNKLIQIGHSTVKIIHVSSFKLQWAKEPIGRVYRALLVTNPEYISEIKLRKALSICFQSIASKENGIKALLNDLRIKNWHSPLRQQLEYNT